MRQLEAHAYPSRFAAWALVATLFFASILNTLDRSMLNFLVDPVRRSLDISDVQISLLQGLSYSVFYVSAGLLLGLIADRTSRIRLLMIGSFLWSAATVAGGLAPSFAWMFLARMMVGFGEATLGPCAMPLISDSFAPARRGRPLSLHLLGGSIASGLAAWAIGWVIQQAPRGTFAHIPGLAHAAPWRIAFVLAGALGAILVTALACQREPPRRGVAVNGSAHMGPCSCKSTWRSRCSRSPATARSIGAYRFSPANLPWAKMRWRRTWAPRSSSPAPSELWPPAKYSTCPS
jgi:MFS family permease